MGPFDPPQRAMPMVLYPQEPSAKTGIHGVPGSQVPNFGFVPHLDGQWAGRLPRNANEVDSWQSPRTEHFGTGDARSRGGNNTPLFQDPACWLSLGSFTAFVGVALNDQTEFGRGNLAVLKGAHHAVQEFFRMQRHQGQVAGPEGPGWPRLAPVGEAGIALNVLPAAVRARFQEGATTTPDGTRWLRPTPILLDEGDAVITLHAVPHCGTRNERGAEPRMNVYFRIRRQRPGGARVLGDSDHPDRGWNGEFSGLPRRLRSLAGGHRQTLRPLERVGRHAGHGLGGRRPHLRGQRALSSPSLQRELLLPRIGIGDGFAGVRHAVPAGWGCVRARAPWLRPLPIVNHPPAAVDASEIELVKLQRVPNRRVPWSFPLRSPSLTSR